LRFFFTGAPLPAPSSSAAAAAMVHVAQYVAQPFVRGYTFSDLPFW